MRGTTGFDLPGGDEECLRFVFQVRYLERLIQGFSISTFRFHSPVDIFTPQKRSEVMSRIRGRDTKPELALRSMLHRLGYRYTVNGPKNKSLPGKPDIVLPKYRTVIFLIRPPSTPFARWVRILRQHMLNGDVFEIVARFTG